MSGRTTRRGFIGLCGAWAAGAWAALGRGVAGATPGLALGCGAGTVPPPGKPVRPERSRVVLVRNAGVVRPSGEIDGGILSAMLDEAVAALVGEASPPLAWAKLFHRGDVVGIKTNVWERLPTPPALEEAIRRRVVGAGVLPGDVAVDDRGVRSNPVFARATALVNARPMRVHAWSGLGTCLKNMIMFAPRPSAYHDDTCASLGALWQLPEIAGKVRLNVLVMLTPHYHGVGPHAFSPRFTWPYGGLLVGSDPVAVDATGARIVVARRKAEFGEDRPLTPSPHHIEVADNRYGLGNADPARTDLVKLGWSEGALV